MTVIFRTDASRQIGFGHLSRCVTLANALVRRNVKSVFVTSFSHQYIGDYLRENGHDWISLGRLSPDGLSEKSTEYKQWLGVEEQEDASEFNQVVRSHRLRPDWIVVDHYALGEVWEAIAEGGRAKVLSIDDLANRAHRCQLLLDQNLFEDSQARYSKLVNSDCRLLLGPQYALLRDEFRNLRQQVAAREGSVKRIFVFFGGADPTNETEKALRAIWTLMEDFDLSVSVVVGAANTRSEELRSLCSKSQRTLFYNNTSRISILMGEADIGIGASGITTWERLSLGLPTVVMAIAKNQEKIAAQLHLRECVFYLGRSGDVDEDRIRSAVRNLMESPNVIRRMSAAGMNLVDGMGTERVVALMTE